MQKYKNSNLLTTILYFSKNFAIANNFKEIVCNGNVFPAILNLFRHLLIFFITGASPRANLPPRHLLKQMPPLHRSGTVPLLWRGGFA